MKPSLDKAVLASELGIKLRNDGMFGFKLPCPVCGKILEDYCWCSITLDEAIRTKQNKKSPYACSDVCLLGYHTFWFEQEDYIIDMIKEILIDPELIDPEVYPSDFKLVSEIKKLVRIKRNFLVRLRKKDFKLYTKLQEWYLNNQDFEYEPYEGDGFDECACEVD